MRSTLRALVPPLLVVASPHDARGQAAGTVSRPLPNVLLLVDSSGSMEKMPDGSLPSENRDPVMIKTLDCPEPVMTPVFINRIRDQLIKRMPCAMPFAVAQQHLSALHAPEEPDPDESLRIAAVSHRRVRGTVKEQV